MTYMMMIKMKEGALNGPPPQELMDAVGAQIEKYQKKGKMVGFGGLLPTSAGAEVRVKGGKLHVVDGPFAEAKEVIGGYAIMKADSKQEAIELAKEFLQMHIDILGDNFEAASEIRQMEEMG